MVTQLGRADPLELAREYVATVWNDGAISSIDAFVADGVVCYATSFGTLEGVAELAGFTETSRAAFPGLEYRIAAATTEGEFVDVDWVATAADRSGPTDRPVLTDDATLRVDDGEIAALWYNFDPWQALVRDETDGTELPEP